MLAWLGPAISQQYFEVGDEVKKAFTDHDPAAAQCFVGNDRGRWQADLYGLARQRLVAAGIQQIFGGDYCTYADPGAFSHFAGTVSVVAWRVSFCAMAKNPETG